MTTVQLIRDAAARRAVLYQYARAHDHWADAEQRLMVRNPCAADYARVISRRVLRAYLAETADPAP
jgi:hypothetical protein